MISIFIPEEGEDVTPETFTWRLDWAKIREARRNDEGTYLLRTNLTDCDPKTLWKIIANLKTIKMVDVVMPTTDGRVVTLPCYVEPKNDVALLLDRLGLTLPGQPPPKISGDMTVTSRR